ncbi:MAG: hypothetical protein Q4C24_00495 [Candidatus Saccharibacteria bacterium]|nr:hypothetical protein [Candidatus Saccharibacteria bacterium]
MQILLEKYRVNSCPTGYKLYRRKGKQWERLYCYDTLKEATADLIELWFKSESGNWIVKIEKDKGDYDDR